MILMDLIVQMELLMLHFKMILYENLVTINVHSAFVRLFFILCLSCKVQNV